MLRSVPLFALVALFALDACASAATPGDVVVPGDTATADARGDGAFDVIDAIDTVDAAGDVPTATDVVVSDGSFTCGSMNCDAATEYCQVLSGGPLADGGSSASYRCDPWAFVCATDHSCACLQHNLKCSTTCMTDAAGNVTTVCGTL